MGNNKSIISEKDKELKALLADKSYSDEQVKKLIDNKAKWSWNNSRRVGRINGNVWRKRVIILN